MLRKALLQRDIRGLDEELREAREARASLDDETPRSLGCTKRELSQRKRELTRRVERLVDQRAGKVNELEAATGSREYLKIAPAI